MKALNMYTVKINENTHDDTIFKILNDKTKHTAKTIKKPVINTSRIGKIASLKEK